MDGTPVAKAHLDLGRVHVDIHQLGRDLQEQHVGRLAAAMQLVLVGRAHGVGDQAITHITAVDEEVLLVSTAAGGFGQAGAALQREWAELGLKFTAGCHEIGAKHITEPAAGALGTGLGAPLRHQAAFVPERKSHLRARKRVAAHRFECMRQLGGIGLEKFAPCWSAEKQLAHLHGGAVGARCGLQLAAA